MSDEIVAVQEETVDDGSLQAFIDQQEPDESGGEEHAGIIDIDVSGDKDPNDPAPHGTYLLEIRKYGPKQSAGGDPMIHLEASIVEARDPGHTEHVGKFVFENMMIGGAGEKFGRWRHHEITEAVRLPLTGGPIAAYIGKRFWAELKVDPGNAQYGPSNRIVNVFKEG